ncbi:MAG: LytR/AlgR family response regulator transcription factor [Sphingopyxis sp.]|jgi:two-component system response regulator AlgR|uniref:LytR/AlgR family response regulator transcription factor n=1 Tax=unclassified Sphingopyxis TaxID=2614943 RepID=UPI00072FC552|nr:MULTISPECIES: LytTR family DNA-binding domain-containing protein [unclassified Sphingopyxis]KTE04271.1 LytTR family transcriptional regulator [Sphingopyxis sp. H012]KTE10888.1 LytTR family transcriptional regulator [Sphingopyxis sp. H093]KTE13528.1 LytTR family transcriptional regulator [Sphingopyxis sp. H053]KTE25612.1 LytTR family transcriptional regulator [Sphingopyxis sp. H080]KTE36760.1 LytTR family transcriptional regulator [Sphingopyxis sp. H038]
MSALHVLLVDDEPLALRRLETLFGDIDDVEVVGTASTGDEAEARIAALRPDLVMLDISMPQKSGIRVAADLVADPRPEIIFVTAFEQYAPDAFEVDAADYLLKPVRFDRLRQAVERARRRRAMRDAVDRIASAPPVEIREEAIWVQVASGNLRLPIIQIEWVEAARDYVLLHTSTRSYIHRISMTALEQLLDPQQLMRVHRSTFIRPALVKAVQRLGKGLIALEMEDGAIVQVGPSYVRAVLDRLGLS